MNSRLEQLQAPDVAVQVLGGHLQSGQLGLFLGSGVSKGLGLPDWGQLVVGCERAAGGAVGPEVDSADAFLSRMDVVRRAVGNGQPFLDLVKGELYGPDLVSQGTFPTDIAYRPLLSALGALVMSSRRGSVSEVFTLNFDDVLDWYLHLHGFRSQSVSDLPCLVDGAVDVRVYHLHGYLPLNERKHHEDSEDIVLTRQQFVSRIAEDSSEPWPALLLTTLLSKVLLIVGTSLNDIDVMQVIERARGKVDGERPLAFFVGTNIDNDLAASLMESTIVPVSLESYDAIPRFLLHVCQEAAHQLD